MRLRSCSVFPLLFACSHLVQLYKDLQEDFPLHLAKKWVSPLVRIKGSKLTEMYPQINFKTKLLINKDLHNLESFPQVRPWFSASGSAEMDTRIASYVQEHTNNFHTSGQDKKFVNFANCIIISLIIIYF